MILLGAASGQTDHGSDDPSPHCSSPPTLTATALPTSTSTPRSGFKIEGCVPHATNSGCGFEFGFVTLSPLNWTARVSGGHFTFENVPPGNYTLTYSERCNPFGCRLPVGVTIADEDVFAYFVLLYPVACAGDCDGSGLVTVDELLRCVEIWRDGSYGCFACDPGRDGIVSVNELVRAVNATLSGCPSRRDGP